MSSNASKITNGATTTTTNPLDVIPDEIPFDVPYGPPISLAQAQAVIQAAVAEAKKRNWKMNIAVADSGGNLVAFQRMDGAMLPPFRSRNIRPERPRPLAPDEGLRGWHPADASELSAGIRWNDWSRGGIPLIDRGVIIGAVGSSGRHGFPG